MNTTLTLVLALIGVLAIGTVGQPTAVCPPWTYATGLYPPSVWPTMCDGLYAVCGQGVFQSPIDLSNVTLDASLVPTTATYTVNTGHEAFNNGYTIRVDVAQTGSMTLTGGPLSKTFHLYQMHLHTRSEHLMNGEAGSLELHLVHATNDSLEELSVVGIVFNVVPGAQPNPFIQKIDDLTPLLRVANESKKYPIELDMSEVTRLINGGSYYTYPGSLTTPPCTEAVEWIVLKDIQPITDAQYLALRSVPAMVGNYRPTLPIGFNRTVRTYDPVEDIVKPAPIGVILGIIAGGLICFVVMGVTVLLTTKVGKRAEYEKIED